MTFNKSYLSQGNSVEKTVTKILRLCVGWVRITVDFPQRESMGTIEFINFKSEMAIHTKIQVNINQSQSWFQSLFFKPTDFLIVRD